jgi:hypothetical protein
LADSLIWLFVLFLLAAATFFNPYIWFAILLPGTDALLVYVFKEEDLNENNLP